MSTTNHDQLITPQTFNTIKAICNVAMKKTNNINIHIICF